MTNKKIRPMGKRLRGEGGKAVKIRTESNGLRPLKTLIVALCIVAQIVFIIELNLYAGSVYDVYVAVSYALSLCMCVYCLSSTKNGLSKAVWIMILLLGFTFGFIFYILSDERFFFRKQKRRYKSIYSRSEKFVSGGSVSNASPQVACDCKYLYSSGGFGAYDGTDVEYFSSGASLFDDVLSRIAKAEKFVFIEFFIISDGVLFDRVIDVLSEKALGGVDVRIIYDDMGSHRSLSGGAKQKIKKAGIKLKAFNRLFPWFNVGLNYRDHRKIIVVDGQTAYSGGCNLADEYINEKRMYGYWKDNGIRLDGKAVDGFTLIFLRQWEYLSKKEEDYSAFLNLYTKTNSTSAVVPFADGLDCSARIGKSVYENVIAGAKERLWIMTPYFVPDEAVTELLKNKATSGVDVRIILPAVPDKAFTYVVTRNNAEKLIKSGVKVYCMENSFVHGKVCLSENCAVIGSVNFDLRSFYQQFECAVYTDDAKTLKSVEQDFLSTVAKSVPITEETGNRAKLGNRLLAGVLQILAPLM